MDEKTMYSLGMIFREIFKFDAIPNGILSTTLRAPASGLAMALKTPAARKVQKFLPDLIGRLPADLSDPPGGIPIVDQGPFWIGYYHYLTYTNMSAKLTCEHLEHAGQLLFGGRWQSELARAIDVNDRRIRQWAAGGKIPPGIWAEIAALLRGRSEETTAFLFGLQRLAGADADGQP